VHHPIKAVLVLNRLTVALADYLPESQTLQRKSLLPLSHPTYALTEIVNGAIAEFIYVQVH
jgi:hypothetical protein